MYLKKLFHIYYNDIIAISMWLVTCNRFIGKETNFWWWKL